MEYTQTEEDLDAIREILNIGIGRSAQMLNCITQSHITLSIPDVSLYSINQLANCPHKSFEDELSNIKLEFSGAFSGITTVSFPDESAAKLVMALTGEHAFNTPDLDSLRIEALKEVGNIIVNGVMGSIGNVLKLHLDYTVPQYEKSSILSMLDDSEDSYDESVLMATAAFKIRDLDVEGKVFMILEVGSLQILLDKIHQINRNHLM